MTKESAIILTPGVSFADWESDLQAALIKKNRLAYVFHDIAEIKPALRPKVPEKDQQSDSEFSLALVKFEDELMRWKEGEIELKICYTTQRPYNNNN